MNEQSRTQVGVAVMVALGFTIIALLGYAVATKKQVTYDCTAKKQELETVASIANATGKLPDGRTLKTGEKVSVDPNMCKVTLERSKTVQLNAKKFQGTDSDLQNTLNPQK